MIACVFPGQGSQTIGMLKDLSAAHSAIIDCFQEASDAISVDLWQLAQLGPEADLNRTENTQPALLAAGVAVFRAWQSAGGALPAMLAGHSLGEYSALVCAGSISLADAAQLVRLRGQAMQRAVPEGVGGMAAVLNAELDVIERACADASEGEVVQPANLNAPGQIVISGHKTAVERALGLLAERGVRRAIRLPVSVPSHCDLMQPAALELQTALASVKILSPNIAVLHNVSAASTQNPDEIRSHLIAQLCGRVRWIESVQALSTAGVTRILECGPGKALTGMNKRISAELLCAAIGEPAEFAQALLG
jgi:[acyl-carrier-protein] S-malonyltransferase